MAGSDVLSDNLRNDVGCSRNFWPTKWLRRNQSLKSAQWSDYHLKYNACQFATTVFLFFRNYRLQLSFHRNYLFFIEISPRGETHGSQIPKIYWFLACQFVSWFRALWDLEQQWKCVTTINLQRRFAALDANPKHSSNFCEYDCNDRPSERYDNSTPKNWWI